MNADPLIDESRSDSLHCFEDIPLTLWDNKESIGTFAVCPLVFLVKGVAWIHRAS